MAEEVTNIDQQLVRRQVSVEEVAGKMAETIIDGNIDPLEAWANLTRFERALKIVKDNTTVRSMAVNELEKYGKGEHALYGTVMKVTESGVSYDYTVCGDNELNALYEQRKEMDAMIKEREKRLRLIAHGMSLVNPETGEILSAPVKKYKTTVSVKTLINDDYGTFF